MQRLKFAMLSIMLGTFASVSLFGIIGGSNEEGPGPEPQNSCAPCH